jgi:hypothetical protein
MRILFLIILLFLFSCAQLSRTPSSALKTRHVVFDIDWTISSEVKPESNGPRIVEIEGKKYYIQDGVEEFIEELLRHDNVLISFFSGGDLNRNHQLLNSVKLHDGRSLENIAYKILNSKDLTPVSNVAATEKFFKRFKKDLRKVSTNLNELVMIDDTEHFVLNEKQEEHVVYLGKTFEYFETFEEAKLTAGEYVPKTESEWSFARKKMFILTGAFHEALKDSEEAGSSLSEAMKIQLLNLDLARSDWNEYSNRMYKISLAINSRHHKKPSNSGKSCVQLFSSFLTE